MENLNTANKHYQTDNNVLTRSKTSYFLITFAILLGLGSIYKIPSYIAEYGGSFLLVFVIFAILIGYPLYLLQINLGKRFHFSVVEMYKNFNRKFTLLGLIQVGVCTVIAITLLGVLAWTGIGFVESFIPGYFNNSVNSIIFYADNNVNTLDWKALSSGIILLILAVIILYIWTKTKFKKILPMLAFIVPLAIIALCVLTAFLPKESTVGLDYLFTIKQSVLNEVGVWRAALGQVLFMLAIGSGALITFNKYSIKNAEVNNFALITLITQIFAVFAVNYIIYAIIGSFYGFLNHENISFSTFLASNKKELQGLGLIFYLFPQAIAMLHTNFGYLGNVYGILVYAIILITTLIAFINFLHSLIDNISEQFLNTKYFAWLIAFTVIGSFFVVFTTNVGSQIVDTIEFWIKQNFILVISLIETIVLTFVIKSTKIIKAYGDPRSLFPVGVVWEIFIGTLVPACNLFVFCFGFFNQTFHINEFMGSLPIIIIYMVVTIIFSFLFIIFGYFAAKFFSSKAYIIKFWTYFLAQIFIIMIFFAVSFKINVIYHDYSLVVEIIGFIFPVLFIMFLPFCFLELSDKRTLSRNV